MIHNYHFVALDLETTGLSPEKDTIIEVAAVRFRLERNGDVWKMVDVEERSMLIDPERPIDEHISMITGISDTMVRGKSKWREVEDRVRDFIGTESIIVGHNVLFDIAMLSSHGIDLSKHRALDTFELSELFSPEAESLNLGFLGKHLGIEMESEHRALDDTKLSAALFLRYLARVVELGERERSLWRYARSRDTSGSIDTLLSLAGDDEQSESIEMDAFMDIPREVKGGESMGTLHEPSILEVIDLSPFWEEEEAIIAKSLKKGKILLFTSSKRQSSWLETKLERYRVARHIDQGEYISLSTLSAFLARDIWTRKETILFLRLAQWVDVTETGRLDELKWYGEEMSYRELFRSEVGEYSRFQRANDEAKNKAEIIIVESHSPDAKSRISMDHTTLIVRDIIDLDSVLRYRESVTIAWKDLYHYIDMIDLADEMRTRCIAAISMIEEIVKGVPIRPTGPNMVPPGDYGETYFYTQRDLWHRGYVWLIWAIEEIETIMTDLGPSDDIIRTKYRTLFGRAITHLGKLIRQGDTNLGLILQIKNNETTLALIPRQMKGAISRFLSLHSGSDTIISGYNISTTYLRDYLSEECGIVVPSGDDIRKAHISVGDSRHISIRAGKTIFLGTNLKNLRTLKEQLSKISHNYPIYTQGVSGGRGKMRTLFEKDQNAILIGLIDTWKDDSLFWEGVDRVYLMKVPFDPPTDPYYLARTSGMANNFENYSLPMAIHTISTLIGRIRSANAKTEIISLDEKLMTMTWGASVREALKI